MKPRLQAPGVRPPSSFGGHSPTHSTGICLGCSDCLLWACTCVSGEVSWKVRLVKHGHRGRRVQGRGQQRRGQCACAMQERLGSGPELRVLPPQGTRSTASSRRGTSQAQPRRRPTPSSSTPASRATPGSSQAMVRSAAPGDTAGGGGGAGGTPRPLCLLWSDSRKGCQGSAVSPIITAHIIGVDCCN